MSKGRGNFEKKNPETGVADKHRIAALKSKGKSISNAEIVPNEDKVRYQELEELYGLEEKDAKLIEAEAGGEITEITNEDWGEGNWVKEYSFDNEQEWLVFDNEEDAEKVAISRVEEDIDDNPEWFPQSILMEHVDAEDAEERFREMYDGHNTGYVDGIEDEDDNEFTNRLASEMYERDLITYEEATDEDFNLEDQKETMVDQMTQESIDEGDYGFDYYKSNFGEDEAFKLLKNWGLVDSKSLAEYVVSSDGIGNTLSGYDGMQVELDNEMV
ncbi:MAG: hypothetical protein KAS66_15780, partial [Candidatus Omnitrophica bacterium]|nr:hypothetical protein [Candidatus Omnitrophota bacterium]